MRLSGYNRLAFLLESLTDLCLSVTPGMRLSGYNRLAFLLESLTDLDRQLRLHGGRLGTLRGQPVDALQLMRAEYGMTHLSFEQVTHTLLGIRLVS